MTMGQRIKLYRKEKHLTQGQLAELIGVSTQAVSKWETDAGMPDISQIVPLAKVLDVSTDKLLGHTNEDFERELSLIRSRYVGINLISDTEEAADLYALAEKFFDKYPDVPEVAICCLECYVELFSKKRIEASVDAFLEVCERYGNSVFRYENNADNICKTYYLMARAYDLCNEAGKAEALMKNLPYMYGDREYWEAEIAYADQKYEMAMDKIKRSFALKARFMARSIRLAVRITKAGEASDANEKAIALNEYMLRLLDALLSGGEYLPHRQVFQKTALLLGLVLDYAKLGKETEARHYLEELKKAGMQYAASLENTNDKECLMFVKDEEAGIWQQEADDIAERIKTAEKIINKYCK